MNVLLTRFVVAMAAIACASASPAQSIEYGRWTKVLPYGFTLLHGNNWTRPLFGVKRT